MQFGGFHWIANAVLNKPEHFQVFESGCLQFFLHVTLAGRYWPQFAPFSKGAVEADSGVSSPPCLPENHSVRIHPNCGRRAAMIAGSACVVAQECKLRMHKALCEVTGAHVKPMDGSIDFEIGGRDAIFVEPLRVGSTFIEKQVAISHA